MSKVSSDFVFVGQTHTCRPCLRGAELHDQRHREIAKLVYELSELDNKALEEKPRKRKQKARVEEYDFLVLQHDSNGDSDKPRVLSFLASTDDGHNISESSPERGITSNKKKPKTYHHQGVRRKIFAAKDIDRIGDIIHCDPTKIPCRGRKPNSLLQTQSIETNTPEISSGKETCVEYIVTEIIDRLGIQHKSTGKPSKERSILLQKLRYAIIYDLETVEHELQETTRRMMGYWRYVDRRTYDWMIHHNSKWEWGTGEKFYETLEKEDFPSEESEKRNMATCLETKSGGESNVEEESQEPNEVAEASGGGSVEAPELTSDESDYSATGSNSTSPSPVGKQSYRTIRIVPAISNSITGVTPSKPTKFKKMSCHSLSPKTATRKFKPTYKLSGTGLTSPAFRWIQPAP